MRVKRGVTSHAKHKKIRKATKGYTGARRRTIKAGKQAAVRSLEYSYRDRRNRKRSMRALWNSRINAAARLHGTSYSKLINGMKLANISLDRKILAELAVNEPKAFEEIIKTAKVD